VSAIIIVTTSAVASLHAQELRARPSRAPCDIFCHARLAHRAEAAGNHAEQEKHVRHSRARAEPSRTSFPKRSRTTARADGSSLEASIGA